MIYCLSQSAFSFSHISTALDAQRQLAYCVRLYALYKRNDDRRHARTENLLQISLELRSIRLYAYSAMIPHLKTDDAVERRIIEQFSLAYLLTIERFVVMMPRKVQDFVGGIKSLNPHFPFRTFASGSSCHLLQHLVCPLIGTEIGLIEERISIQHRYQTDVIKMEPFGDHLRADQYIALMVSKRIDDILIGGFITGGV